MEFYDGLWHNFDLFEHPTELDSMEEHEAKQKVHAALKFKELDVDRCMTQQCRLQLPSRPRPLILG